MVQSVITCINTSCEFNFSRKFLLHKSWLTILIKRSHTQKLSLLTPICHDNFSLSWISGKFILSTSFEFQSEHCTWCHKIPRSFSINMMALFSDNTYRNQRWALSGQIWPLNPIFDAVSKSPDKSRHSNIWPQSSSRYEYHLDHHWQSCPSHERIEAGRL